MSISEVKKHIDNARQILVGVVPNPTSQIDQITNALIYKFMDDMDQQSIKIGGKASFFTGDLEKYSWSQIISKSHQEKMNLYVEGFQKIAESKKIPPLFRNILKSAYLPYRQPETLGLFLKEINHFDYSHHEELGDAYEYLLSIMSSQGDAGQFRTPRHIIDFMVDVIDPKKDETILDPACGTAGFLISSYKHILKFHQDKKNKDLTPQDKKDLMENFEGYDIDPAMTRIAQVNMFLHNFKTPKIFQYDALSSEEKWNDKFDVILANPPFMSPKGGIKPHQKFSVESSRSEVLFVDYIMNHLNSRGRAAIIVPEGIIFQSGTSYKDLRKNLVNDGLYAVASLPSGVFNPYSGVKTSILFFDKEFAKSKGDILFVKIENDGFHLGAQRRPIDKNDLPKAAEILKQYKKGKKIEDKIAAYVGRKEIAKSGDYNLSAARYVETVDYSNAKWSMVELGELCEFIRGITFNKNDEVKENYILVATTKSAQADGIKYENLIKVSKKKITNPNTILRNGDFLISVANSSNLLGRKTFVKNALNGNMSFGAFMGCLRPDISKIIPEYLNPFLESEEYKAFCLSRANTTTNISNLNWSDLRQFKIPLPPLEIQEQIVRELNSYQNIITGARQIINNWKPKIDVDPSWQVVKLDDVCEINPKKSEIKELNQNLEVSFVPMSDLGQNEAYFLPTQIRKISELIGSYTYFAENDVLLARVTPCFENGKAGIAKNLKNQIGFGSSEYIVLRPTKKVMPEIIYSYITTQKFNIEGKEKMTGTGGLQRVPVDFVRNYEISVPPLETQQKIVAQIESERQSVESAKKLIEIFDQKTKDSIAKLWK